MLDPTTLICREPLFCTIWWGKAARGASALVWQHYMVPCSTTRFLRFCQFAWSSRLLRDAGLSLSPDERGSSTHTAIFTIQAISTSSTVQYCSSGQKAAIFVTPRDWCTEPTVSPPIAPAIPGWARGLCLEPYNHSWRTWHHITKGRSKGQHCCGIHQTHNTGWAQYNYTRGRLCPACGTGWATWATSTTLYCSSWQRALILIT